MKKNILSLLLVSMISLPLISCGANKSDSALKDGKYEIESASADDRGYKYNLSIEVKDGKISSATYDELKESDNTKKRDDKDYNTKMKAASGVSIAEACITLEKELIDKQSANIDTVTGATGSTENFKKLATKLLENAKEGKTDKSTIDMK